MTDDEIRALVREAVSRHLGGQPAPLDSARGALSAVERASGGSQSPSPGHPASPPAWRAHASFGRFLVASGTEDDGACLIEPRVRCNHCGYCQSYGH